MHMQHTTVKLAAHVQTNQSSCSAPDSKIPPICAISRPQAIHTDTAVRPYRCSLCPHHITMHCLSDHHVLLPRPSSP